MRQRAATDPETTQRLIAEIVDPGDAIRLPWDALSRKQKRDVVRTKSREARLAYGFGKVNR